FSSRCFLASGSACGAEVLGRDGMGCFAPGRSADLIGARIDSLPMGGSAVHDPLAALLFTQPANVALTVVAGRVLVKGGDLACIELGERLRRHGRLARALVG